MCFNCSLPSLPPSLSPSLSLSSLSIKLTHTFPSRSSNPLALARLPFLFLLRLLSSVPLCSPSRTWIPFEERRSRRQAEMWNIIRDGFWRISYYLIVGPYALLYPTDSPWNGRLSSFGARDLFFFFFFYFYLDYTVFDAWAYFTLLVEKKLKRFQLFSAFCFLAGGVSLRWIVTYYVRFAPKVPFVLLMNHACAMFRATELHMTSFSSELRLEVYFFFFFVICRTAYAFLF